MNENPWEGVVGKVMLGFDPAGDDVVIGEVVDTDKGPVLETKLWDAAIKERQGFSTTFTVFDETHELLFKKPEPVEQAMSFRVDYDEPSLPPLMGKHPGCVGKKYRAYRRWHRRLRQQWKKDGCPTRSMSFYMPRVEVMFDELTQTMTATAVSAGNAAKAIQTFGDAFAMHPSNWKSNG